MSTTSALQVGGKYYLYKVEQLLDGYRLNLSTICPETCRIVYNFHTSYKHATKTAAISFALQLLEKLP
jgi:hypothetical protein